MTSLHPLYGGEGTPFKEKQNAVYLSSGLTLTRITKMDNNLFVFSCMLDDETEAELHVIKTDEGLAYDVYQNGKLMQSSYDFVEDIVARTS